MRRALDLLGRASEDWRNGTPRESGSLHWPVAVNLARRELRQALKGEPDLRHLLKEATERLRGWSEGSGPDDKLRARIEAVLAPPLWPREQADVAGANILRRSHRKALERTGAHRVDAGEPAG
jgi:hypothetical protein